MARERNRELRFGPYSPPKVRVGQYATCERRGLIRVHSWSDREEHGGKIMWPLGIPNGISPGSPSMILMGDLVRALKRESAIAVAKYWGTTWRTVCIWRRALGIKRVTEGTRMLLAEGGNMGISEFAAEGNRKSLLPINRQKRDKHHSATLRTKPGWADHMRQLATREHELAQHARVMKRRPNPKNQYRTQHKRPVLAVESIACPRCAALAGQRCYSDSRSGYHGRSHAARWRAVYGEDWKPA